MQLSEEDIREFQEMYKARFGKEISKEDACDSALKLIRYVKVLIQPIRCLEEGDDVTMRQKIKTCN